MKSHKWFFSFFVIFLLLCNSCTKSEQNIPESKTQKITRDENIYKIAVAAPQFGPYQALGLSIIHGAEIAVEMKNNKGGINKEKIELIKVDDGGLPGESIWRANGIVNEMVLGVIGHLNSDISIPASEIYSMAMIVQISPGSTNPLFTERDSVRGFVFRTIGRDDMQGEISAKYVINHGFKKVAVVYNNRSYGSSLSKEFIKRLENKNVKIVLNETYKVGNSNFLKQVKSFVNLKPDVVFFVGEYGDAARFLRQLRSAGVNSTFIGTDGVFDQEFIDKGKQSVEKALVISTKPVKDKAFAKTYKQKFGKELGSYSAASFDATNILIQAIEKVKEKEPKKIAEEVQMTQNFPGLLGKLSFNSKGDLVDPLFSIYEVKNGMFVSVGD